MSDRHFVVSNVYPDRNPHVYIITWSHDPATKVRLIRGRRDFHWPVVDRCVVHEVSCSRQLGITC